MTTNLERVKEFLEHARQADSLRRASESHLICQNCEERIEFTRGKAFTGWVHSNGHLVCEGKHSIADPKSNPSYLLGRTITDLETMADRIKAGHDSEWSGIYFETGELSIPVWAVLARVRVRLCGGANDTGQMSPGAIEAWFLLGPLQEEFEREKSGAEIRREQGISDFSLNQFILGGNANG